LYCNQNRPGKFWHTCTVTSNSKPESTTIITIKWEYLVPKDDK
jgi:hypothetical protein